MAENLKGRERLLDPARALELLRETAVPSGWDIERILAIESIKERPGRRCIVRYRVAARSPRGHLRDRVLYGKLYRGQKGRRVRDALAYLRAAAPPVLKFPEALGYNDRRRFLLVRRLKGDSLGDRLEKEHADLDLANFGCSLAAFHDLPRYRPSPHGPLAFPGPDHGARAEVRVLEEAWNRLRASSSLPADLLRRYRASEEEVSLALHGDAPENRTASDEGMPAAGAHIIHRDLHPHQVMVQQDTFGLLDLDECARGEPELDAGNFVAHLFLGDLRKKGRIDRADDHARIFLGAYAVARPIRLDRLRIYTAGAFLRLASLERLAHRDISVLTWPELAPALLERAELLLSS